MPRYGEDQEDDKGFDQGHNSHASGGRGDFGQTSSFNTTMISDDGRFLGMKLSPEMASQFRTFYPALLDWARRKAEKFGVPWAEKFAKSALKYSEHDAGRFGGKAGNVIGYGVILSNQIFDVGRNIYDSTQSLHDLRVAVRPLAKIQGDSGQSTPLSGNNEVVSNARSKINGAFWQRLLQTATGTIAALPALAIKWNEQGTENAKREMDRALEEAKNNPDKVAEILKKKLVVGGAMEGVEAADMQAGMEKLIETERAVYVGDLNKYVADRKPIIVQRLDAAVAELNSTNIKSQIRSLEECNLDAGLVKGLNEALEKRYDYTSRRYIRPTQEEIQQAIEEFKADFAQSKNYFVEEALKAGFVRQHPQGAFDEDYQDYLVNQGNGQKRTIKEEWERKIEELRSRQKKTEHDTESETKDHDTSKIGNMAAGLGAGFVAELATKALGGKALEKYRQPIALDRILHLRRELEKAGDNPPEQVPGIQLDKGRNDKDVSYTEYVHKVFQQHQKDCGRTEVGSRFFEHFDQARWDDGAIQQLADDQLTAYEYAVKTIAKRIKDGRMDAIALVTLAGDRQKRIVHDDGRSFGPRGSGKEDATIKAAILKVVDEQTVMLHVGHDKTDAQVNEKLGNFIFNVSDLKRALESKEMDSQQRAFIFTLFSDVVGSDEKLCQQIGISNQRCQELRAETKEHFNNLLDAAVTVLAEMIEKHPEEVEKTLKLTDKEKEMIRTLAGRSAEEGKSVADLTENREEIKSLETLAANAAMALKGPVANDEEGKPQNFWQRLMAASRRPKKPIEKKEKAASHRESIRDAEDAPPHAERFSVLGKDDAESEKDIIPNSAITREAARREKLAAKPTELGA